MAQAPTFGFGWLGDGATIQCMPLINMMVIYGYANPVVVSICDCTNHMSEGGKQDATYIAMNSTPRVEKQMSSSLMEQKMFRRQAKFCVKPCFHGGEHVLSLFFSDLSNLKHIQVSQSDF